MRNAPEPGPTVEIRVQTLTLTPDGVVRVKMKQDSEMQLADAREAVAAVATLGAGRALPVMIDLSGAKYISREARAYLAGPETARVETAAALLVDSPVTRAFGNFFLGLNKPRFPTRLFTSEADALAWLASYTT
ncbi:MAG: STAS/SEC14 domain-containing protein [Archangiaceae bacterium]|nr:STAS/SEC14 domain-containing protein [Archangiaceae bacterium]